MGPSVETRRIAAPLAPYKGLSVRPLHSRRAISVTYILNNRAISAAYILSNPPYLLLKPRLGNAAFIPEVLRASIALAAAGCYVSRQPSVRKVLTSGVTGQTPTHARRPRLRAAGYFASARQRRPGCPDRKQ